MSEPRFPVDTSDLRLEEAGRAKPRRAKQHKIPWTEIALGGWFAIAGLIGAFIGTILAQLI